MTTQEISTRYQGVQKDSAGYKLLKGMGWKEGEGLGASKQGIKEHIRVKKKFENWGVGAVESHDRARDWSNGMSEFHRVLSTLSEITSKHAGSSEASDTDDVSEEESKNQKKKKKKRVKKEKKNKKDKKRSKECGDNEGNKKRKKGGSNQEADELEEVKRVENPVVKKATHIGRFKKRETSKMVKGYSTSDLAAILGEDPFAKQQIEEIKAPIEQECSEMSVSDAEDPSEMVPPSTNSWWSNYFVLGPRAGSKGEKRRVAKKSIGFSEKDQENLYSSAHDNATTGRVGLGRSSMPKKVAGVRWAGTKTRLDSDDDDDDDDDNSNDSNQSEQEEEEDVAITIVMPTTKLTSQDGRMDAVIKAALSKEKNNCMKLKSLVKHVVKVIGGSCEKTHVSGFIESNTKVFKMTQDSKKKTFVSLVSSTD